MLTKLKFILFSFLITTLAIGLLVVTNVNSKKTSEKNSDLVVSHFKKVDNYDELSPLAQAELNKLLASEIDHVILTQFYNKIRDDFLTNIKPILTKLQTIKITSANIDIKGTKQNYSWLELTKPINIGKSYDTLTNQAKNEFIKLFINSVNKQKLEQIFQNIETRKILAFQKNWDAGEVSTYLLWLSIFDIEEVKLSQNKTFPIVALATTTKTMLAEEKFDFIKLKGKARRQLLSLLDAQGTLKEAKTFQDDVWRQIKNHKKWKVFEGLLGHLVLQSIRNLLFKIQDLGIKKVVHPFFPRGYDLSFLQDNSDWKKITFKDLLAGMTMKINGTNVEFYSHLFPNKVVFQVPMKILTTVFSEITIANIIKNLELAITDSSRSKKQSESKNQGLIIGLSIGWGVLMLSALGSFLYWFFKIKK